MHASCTSDDAVGEPARERVDVHSVRVEEEDAVRVAGVLPNLHVERVRTVQILPNKSEFSAKQRRHKKSATKR